MKVSWIKGSLPAKQTCSWHGNTIWYIKKCKQLQQVHFYCHGPKIMSRVLNNKTCNDITIRNKSKRQLWKQLLKTAIKADYDLGNYCNSHNAFKCCNNPTYPFLINRRQASKCAWSMKSFGAFWKYDFLGNQNFLYKQNSHDECHGFLFPPFQTRCQDVQTWITFVARVDIFIFVVLFFDFW